MPRPRRSTPETLHRAGELRKTPTPAEARLWACLRVGQLRGANFRRQHTIGAYIADFCSPRHKLVIEVDGSQHMDQAGRDAQRTAYLEGEGYRVLRFWNNDVLNHIDSVIQVILKALGEG